MTYERVWGKFSTAEKERDQKTVCVGIGQSNWIQLFCKCPHKMCNHNAEPKAVCTCAVSLLMLFSWFSVVVFFLPEICGPVMFRQLKKKKNKLDSINMAFSHLLTAVFILPMENYQSFIPDRIDFDSLFSVYWKAQLSYVMAHFQFKRETILPESQNKFDDLCIRILNCSNNN